MSETENLDGLIERLNAEAKSCDPFPDGTWGARQRASFAEAATALASLRDERDEEARNYVGAIDIIDGLRVEAGVLRTRAERAERERDEALRNYRDEAEARDRALAECREAERKLAGAVQRIDAALLTARQSQDTALGALKERDALRERVGRLEGALREVVNCGCTFGDCEYHEIVRALLTETMEGKP